MDFREAVSRPVPMLRTLWNRQKRTTTGMSLTAAVQTSDNSLPDRSTCSGRSTLGKERGLEVGCVVAYNDKVLILLSVALCRLTRTWNISDW